MSFETWFSLILDINKQWKFCLPFIQCFFLNFDILLYILFYWHEFNLLFYTITFIAGNFALLLILMGMPLTFFLKGVLSSFFDNLIMFKSLQLCFLIFKKTVMDCIKMSFSMYLLSIPWLLKLSLLNISVNSEDKSILDDF